MRFVVVTTSFPQHPNDPSGHFVQSSALALHRSGHQVHVIAPGSCPHASPTYRDGLIIHWALGQTLFTWPGAMARLQQAPHRLASFIPYSISVLRYLRALAPFDRSIAHWIIPSAWPLMLSLPPHVPLTVHAHGADIRLLLNTPDAMRHAIMRSLLRRQVQFVFPAQALLDALCGALSNPLRNLVQQAACVELPSMDMPDVTERAHVIRRQVRPEENELLAVVVCRLIPTKRVHLAIEAVAQAQMRLVVVGDGPEQPALQQLANELHAAVKFVGAVSRPEALAWIAAADLLLHPSGQEGAPTVIREARALGVPVVACDAGDIAHWATIDRGIVVAPPTSNGFAQAIRTATPCNSHRFSYRASHFCTACRCRVARGVAQPG